MHRWPENWHIPAFGNFCVASCRSFASRACWRCRRRFSFFLFSFAACLPPGFRDFMLPYECRVRLTTHTRRPQQTPGAARSDARSHAIVATAARLQQRPLTCSGRLQRHPPKPPLGRSSRACAALEHCWHLQAVPIDPPEPLTVATGLRSSRRSRPEKDNIVRESRAISARLAGFRPFPGAHRAPPGVPPREAPVYRAEGPARAPVPSPRPALHVSQAIPGPGAAFVYR